LYASSINDETLSVLCLPHSQPFGSNEANFSLNFSNKLSLSSSLSKFLDAYNNYEGANGVWISGFFGSGKSHLLKMVALLLENKQINDTSVLDTFLQKVNDEIIRADLKKATSIPSS
jgi:chromosomal replication initiation ATPase DnaA